MSKIVDQNSGKCIYDLAINLPYVLNVTEFERRYELIKQNLSDNQKEYFEKLYSKKNDWSRAYNKQDSLDSHCTGIVENINKQLKEHVGLKCTLVEYLYRSAIFTSKFNHYDELPREETLQFNSYYNLVKSSVFVLSTKRLNFRICFKEISYLYDEKYVMDYHK